MMARRDEMVLIDYHKDGRFDRIDIGTDTKQYFTVYRRYSHGTYLGRGRLGR